MVALWGFEPAITSVKGLCPYLLDDSAIFLSDIKVQSPTFLRTPMHRWFSVSISLLVLTVGIEPTRIAPRDFKSRVSANSTTSTYFLVSGERLELSRHRATDFESVVSAYSTTPTFTLGL